MLHNCHRQRKHLANNVSARGRRHTGTATRLDGWENETTERKQIRTVWAMASKTPKGTTAEPPAQLGSCPHTFPSCSTPIDEASQSLTGKNNIAKSCSNIPIWIQTIEQWHAVKAGILKVKTLFFSCFSWAVIYISTFWVWKYPETDSTVFSKLTFFKRPSNIFVSLGNLKHDG